MTVVLQLTVFHRVLHTSCKVLFAMSQLCLCGLDCQFKYAWL